MKPLLFICLVACFFSCKEETNPIPVLHVFLELDLSFEDKELKAVPSCKEYTAENIIIGKEYVGYGGVLVVHTMLGEYKAFDLACPYEAVSKIKVKADDATLYAICPKCESRYDIGFGTGAPEGKSKHYLRRYSTFLSGSKLIVKN